MRSKKSKLLFLKDLIKMQKNLIFSRLNLKQKCVFMIPKTRHITKFKLNKNHDFFTAYA